MVSANILIVSLTVSLYSGWKVWHTAKQVHNTLGEKLVDKSGSKSYSKWDHIKLVAQHSLDSSVFNLMASAL